MPDPDRVAAALAARAAALQQRLLDKVEANLSGDVLQSRSGTLKASVVTDLVADVDAIAVSLESRGVAYAAIQEYGGTTPPHDIVPVKARALAFAGGVFARGASSRVGHPGAGAVRRRARRAARRDRLQPEGCRACCARSKLKEAQPCGSPRSPRC